MNKEVTSEPQLTSEQDRALTTRSVSVGLSAGAGCGKTFVLTRRFLGNLEPGPDAIDIGSLVAITYTERAAREMRHRIRQACHDRSRDGSPEEIAHWQRVLRGLDAARIGTIHAFCGSLLRAHAVEAGLDPAFEILDNQMTRMVHYRVLRSGLGRLIAGDDRNEVATEAARRLVHDYGLEQVRERVRSLLAKTSGFPFDQWESLTESELIDEWKAGWERMLAEELSAFVADSRNQECLSAIAAAGPYTGKAEQTRTAILENFPTLPTCDDPESLRASLREATLFKHWKEAGKQEDFLDLKPLLTELRKRLDNLEKKTTPLERDDDVLHAARVSLDWVRLMRSLRAEYQAVKARESLVDFDDLLLFTRDLLASDEPLRKRIAERIGFLMVDEFQDTDRVQAEIVRMLCDGDIGSGRLFLVGDQKQSIYRFRKADPAVFSQLRGELPEAGRLPLSRNFRSQAGVIDFVNHVFAPAMGTDYEPLTAHHPQVGPLPAVELLTATRDAKSEDEPEPKPSAVMLRKWEADWLARRLRTLIDSGEECVRDATTGRLRPARAGDIALLCRSLNDVSLYEDALRRWGLPYYLVGGRAFYAQQEVRDVANFCRVLDEPDDQLALVGILRSPMFGLSDETLFLLSQDSNSETLAEAIVAQPPPGVEEPQASRVRAAGRIITELRSLKDRLPLAALLNRMLDLTGYDAALVTEFLGERKLANLRKLVDQARDFDRSGLFTLREFVVRLRDSVLEQTDEALAVTEAEESDVIRIMTVHQSKGLEFPIVCVVDVNRQPPNATSETLHPTLGGLVSIPKRHGQSCPHPGMTIFAHQEAEEERRESLRVFYVATTRAADRLLLSMGGDPQQKQHEWLSALGSVYDFATGEPLGSGPALGLMREPDAPEVKEATRSERTTRLAEIPQAVLESELAPAPPLLESVTRQPSGEALLFADWRRTDDRTARALLLRLLAIGRRYPDQNLTATLDRLCRGKPEGLRVRLEAWLRHWKRSEVGRVISTANDVHWSVPICGSGQDRGTTRVLTGTLDVVAFTEAETLGVFLATPDIEPAEITDRVQKQLTWAAVCLRGGDTDTVRTRCVIVDPHRKCRVIAEA